MKNKRTDTELCFSTRKGFIFKCMLLYFFLSFFFVSASEIEPISVQKGDQSKFYVSEHTVVVGIENITIGEPLAKIYVTSDATIYGENYISNAEIVQLPDANTKENSNDHKTILGISKGFVSQKKSKDLVLKKNQEKSIEKVKSTLFLSLSNSTDPTLFKLNSDTGIISSSSSSLFCFEKLQNIQTEEVCLFLPNIKREEFHCYFVYFDNKKISKLLLRGPPSV